MNGLLALLVAEAEQNPQLVERLRRVLGSDVASVGAPGPAMMTIAKFAEHIGCSGRHVFKMIGRGLPTCGDGRARRVIVADALRWMREQQSRNARPHAREDVANDAELPEVAQFAAARARRRRRAAP